ncbi:DUF6612 family protein [Thermoflavimicrobium dichotomicum]|uniref:Lipoprotein n=1 Tax=Thermoflavimicrobium dichotomicum TaxID=46223 RepID=A0A1I3NHG1_9BACL|nr:DUF6612 family protein [Thermoflavimicrobium dichotomicum]SFJ08607.1 hypothetical protein SAMN05421852_104141 [Thermoflavimicrobium dichotomicum]
MKRYGFAIFITGLIVSIMTGCSLLGIESGKNSGNTNAAPKKLTADEVLTKSWDAMSKLKGYKWERKVEQSITAEQEESSKKQTSSKEEAEARNTANQTFEYIDTDQLHLIEDLTTEAKGKETTIKTDLYIKDGMAYLKSNKIKNWKKMKPTSKLVEPFVDSLEYEYINPKFVIQLVKKEIKSIKMKETSTTYQLDLLLNDDQKAQPFIKGAKERLEHFQIGQEEKMKVHSFKLSLFINKTDFKLSKVTQEFELDLPLKKSTLKIQQQQTVELQGEVKEIQLPEELQENNSGSKKEKESKKEDSSSNSNDESDQKKDSSDSSNSSDENRI